MNTNSQAVKMPELRPELMLFLSTKTKSAPGLMTINKPIMARLIISIDVPKVNLKFIRGLYKKFTVTIIEISSINL